MRWTARRWWRTQLDVGGIVLCCTVLWTGCGGGGGGGSGGAAESPTPRATSTTAPTATFTFEPSPTLTTAAPSPTQPPPTLTPLTPATTPTEVVAPATPTETATLEPTSTFPPEPTATATPLIGPIVTAFGTADSSGTFNQPIGTDAEGRPIFSRVSGNDFIVYVEGRPGISRLPVAINLLSTQLDNPVGQPDLQLVSSMPLGDGSPAVCDKSFPNVGGVPAVDPPDFSFLQSVSNALNDISCRFKRYEEADFACTQDSSGAFLFANGGSTVQFCVLINDALTLPTGDTVLTVRLRDTAGRAGPMSQIVVRVRGQ